MAQIPPQPRNRDDFRIAIICALPLEAEMVQSVFGKDWADEGVDLGQAEGDQNAYSIGTIGKHNVVLAYMPGMGGTNAAAVAAGLRSSYLRIEVAFVVGICGVAPKHPVTQREIVLGDCIVSTTVIQYDFGRQYPGMFKRKAGLEDTLGRANPTIRAVVAKLQTGPNLKRLSSKLQYHLEALRQVSQIEYPGCREDWLFKNSYLHKHHGIVGTCDDCMEDVEICTRDCKTLECNQSELIDRDRLKENGNAPFVSQPQLHFGRYGSANTVLKSGEDRERLVRDEEIVAFEMEGAGVWDNLPTILVKSACDYADSHKNKRWQRYAAATAAAGLKSILEFWRVTDVAPEQNYKANAVHTSLGTHDLIRQADEVIHESYHSSGHLLIERLSGEELELDKCFINLALVDRSERRNDREESSFSLEARLQLHASSVGQNVSLETLFESRKLANDKTIIPRRIFIQGRAGVGKTTLCKKIVYEFLGGRLGQTLFDRLLWISLRRLETSQKEYGWQQFLQDAYPLTSPKWRQVKDSYADQFYDPVFLGRTLFLFDGLDEISYRWKHDDPMYEFLKTNICNAPNIIITSRPQASTFSIRYDLDLETIGFTRDQVSVYIRNCVGDEETVAKMETLIDRKPLIQGLLRIPIQLDAFCYTWTSGARSDINSSSQVESDTPTTDGFSTMTTLYQSIVIEICRKDLRRLQRVDQPQQLMSFQVLPWLEEELTFLAELAFQGMVNNIIEFSPKHQNRVGAYLSQSSMKPSAPYSSILERLSFLRTSDVGKKDYSKQNYHFIHLTFQEFFAAKHFADHWLHNKPLTCLQLTSSGSDESKTPFTFLQEEKYNPRYNIFWRFVTGLICDENEVVRFFAQLRAEPVDLLGTTSCRLLMYCLSEVVRNQNREVEELYSREADLLRQRLITEYKLTGGTQLGREAEFPEQVLRACLWDELDLPYEATLWMIHGRSGVQLETLKVVADKLESRFPLGVCLGAAEVLMKNSTVCPPGMLEPAFTVLITAVENPDTRDRAAKVWLEQSSLPERVINALIASVVLEAKHSLIRSNAVITLEKQSSLPERAISALITATLEHEDRFLREEAATVLGKKSSLPEGTINALIAALKSAQVDMRIRSARVLRTQSSLPKRAINALIAALKDENFTVRYSAAIALGEHSSLPEGTINDLVMELMNGDHGMRRDAEMELRAQRSLPEGFIDALIAALKSEHTDLRVRTAGLLGIQPSLPKRAINALIAALKDENFTVRYSAAIALGEHSSLPEGTINYLIMALMNGDSSTREDAAKAMRNQSSLPEEAVNSLVAVLECEEVNVRVWAIWALAAQPSLPEEAINALIAVLQDEDKDSETRCAAAEVLTQHLSLHEGAVNAIIAVLQNKSKHHYLRKITVCSLADQSSLPERLVNPLIAMLQDEVEYSGLRIATVSSLRDQSSLPDGAIVALIRMLSEDKSDVYDILHHQRAFFHMIKDLDNQTWARVWSIWLESDLYNDISCYELQGILYIWSNGIRYHISSDPVRISQLREAVLNISSDILKGETAIVPLLTVESASSKAKIAPRSRVASRSRIPIPIRKKVTVSKFNG